MCGSWFRCWGWGRGREVWGVGVGARRLEEEWKRIELLTYGDNERTTGELSIAYLDQSRLHELIQRLYLGVGFTICPTVI